jgi:hypothetical protein
MRIWNQQDEQRRSRSIREPGVLPLRDHDQIRIDAQLNRAAFLYLVWIDTEGNALPVYPWTLGDWNRRPVIESPTARISLPERGDMGWPIEGGPGIETLVVLARDTPWPNASDLPLLLAGLTNRPSQANTTFVEFDGESLLNRRGRGSRSPMLSAPQPIDDSLLKAHQVVAQKLAPHFRVIRAVTFANRGE